jgi:hypothetical protein
VLDRSGNSAAPATPTTFKVAKFATAPSAASELYSAHGSGAVIDGGAGLDAAMYRYQRSSYAINNTGSEIYVKQLGSDIGDRLVGIERAVFSDVGVAFDINGNGGQAYRLYQAAFNRTPDQGGVGFWMSMLDKGMSLSAVAREFVASAEFKSMYGANTTNAAFVDLLYSNVLHRQGDQAGVDYWNKALADGFQREELLLLFSESGENKAAIAEVIGNGFNYTPYS